MVSVVGVGAIALAWWAFKLGHNESQPYQNMRVSTQTNRGDVFDCVLSPDGRYLAYLAGRSGHVSLRVRQVATGSDVDTLWKEFTDTLRAPKPAEASPAAAK